SFQFSVFPIQLKNNQRAAFDLCFAIKLVYLLAMQQQLTNTFCLRNFVTGALVRLNVRIIKERFAVLDPGESIANVRLARSNRLNLAPLEFDARFVALENVIIAKRFAVGN